jgi:uncharacterized 2Fe-2S/4Fe-4S cluster protein (DUF4445 family)
MKVSEVFVTVEPEGRKIRTAKGESLLTVLRASGVSVRSECGGRGVCGKCKIVVKETSRASEMTEAEMSILTGSEIALNVRLACQVRVNGDLTVMIPVESRLRQRRIQVEGVETSFELNPAIRKLRAQPSKSTIFDAKPNAERLLSFLEEKYDLNGLTIGYDALKKLPRALNASKREITATIWSDHKVIDVEAGDTIKLAYGIAVDIGTSKIVGQLVSLDSGQVVATNSIENPQIIHGEDVISRITFASESEGGMDKLRSLVIDGVNYVISMVSKQGGVRRENIYEMTLVGNSAMHHILLGIPPLSLAVAPYVPTVKRALNLGTRDLEVQISDGGNIHLLPLIAGFVGSDDVADVLATRVHTSEELTLLIDIGTNTEVNLGNRDGVLCCSCASGPAFEGAHIHDGMKAVQGAIERVSLNSRNYKVKYEVIGGGKPVGICGSGMIDILAELVRCNLIDQTGRINDESPTERIRRVNESWEFVIAWSEETDKEDDIVITQGDIRELQLAKAAIYTGCSVLMRRRGIRAGAIERICLAGAFGNFIDPANAKIVGIIPDIKSENVVFVGNAALSGARMALLSTDMRRDASELSEKLTYVELGAEPKFNEELIAATYLPHKNLDLFPSFRESFERKRGKA